MMGLFIFLKMINPIRKKRAPHALGHDLSILLDASRSFISPRFFKKRTVMIGSTVLKKNDKKKIKLGLSIVFAV